MDKGFLFEDLAEEDKVELRPGRDGTARIVTIRPISRAELHAMRKRKDFEDPEVAERVMLATAVVDPVIDVNDAKLWQQADKCGDITKVIARIGDISGMGEDAQKEAYKSLPDESGS